MDFAGRVRKAVETAACAGAWVPTGLKAGVNATLAYAHRRSVYQNHHSLTSRVTGVSDANEPLRRFIGLDLNAPHNNNKRIC
jgi:hypothetical protein